MISRLFILIMSFIMTIYIVVSLATTLSARHEKDFYHSLNKDFGELQASLHSETALNTFMPSEEIKTYTKTILDNKQNKNPELKPEFQRLLNNQAGIFERQLSEKVLTRESGEPAGKALAEYFKDKDSKIKKEDLRPYLEKYKNLNNKIDNYGAWKSSVFFKYSVVISISAFFLVILILVLSLVFQHESFETSIKYTTYGTLMVNGAIYLLLFMIFLFISP